MSSKGRGCQEQLMVATSNEILFFEFDAELVYFCVHMHNALVSYTLLIENE